MTAFGPSDFAAATGVSRETLSRLEMYAKLLQHWQKRINLVAAASLADLWRRHMLDSAQLLSLVTLPAGRHWVDLGSGAGFPGLVVAICAPPLSDLTVHLVESDQRKVAFLHEVIRQTQARAIVHPARIEELPYLSADVVSARALAPLEKLLPLAEKFWKDDSVGLFLKGRRVDDELRSVSDCWSLTYDVVPSISDSSGRIVRLRKLRRVR